MQYYKVYPIYPVWAAHKNFAVLVIHKKRFPKKKLKRGENTKLENPDFQALKVTCDQLDHQGWIPGLIVTCLDPYHLSVSQK